jgi:hypothetical protein
VTIHEFANLQQLQKLNSPGFQGPGGILFPAEDTDVLASSDGLLVIAINRLTGRYAGQRGSNFVSGFATDEMTAEQVAHLSR